MSEVTVSHIHMASSSNKGSPDIAVALSPEHDHRRNPWRTLLDLSLIQMLAFICAIMACVIIVLGFALGFSLYTDSNQHRQLNDLQTRVTQLNNRVTNLEQHR